VKPPVLIEIKYRGASAGRETVALVGKGITFDSGGICLKPSPKMEDMRYDMSGAAAVLGIIRAAARMNLAVNLVGVIPAAENMPSGSAVRPGDIVKSLSGQYIEVLNTDAEGRLVLADGLTYALRHKPACLIDLATLTGAVSVALGNLAIGLLSNDDALAREMRSAGERSGERVWQLPLWEEYQDLIKSENADMANISAKPVAGTIIGGIFLQKFVQDVPWLHLDIAGTAYGDENALYAKGATGVGVRLILEWLAQRIKLKQ
jgi:leucyl aminopeptidase